MGPTRCGRKFSVVAKTSEPEPKRRTVTIMQSAVSVSFFSPEFNEFLHAPIGEEPNEMPLSVLSGFARLNIDPWCEAAALSALPREDAVQRLALLIERLPGRRWTGDDCRAIAERLATLLPSRRQADEPIAQVARSYVGNSRCWSSATLIYVAAALLLLIAVTRSGVSPSGDHLGAPTIGSASPAQTTYPDR
jgi:hypothetical protein